MCSEKKFLLAAVIAFLFMASAAELCAESYSRFTNDTFSYTIYLPNDWERDNFKYSRRHIFRVKKNAAAIHVFAEWSLGLTMDGIIRSIRSRVHRKDPAAGCFINTGENRINNSIRGTVLVFEYNEKGVWMMKRVLITRNRSMNYVVECDAPMRSYYQYNNAFLTAFASFNVLPVKVDRFEVELMKEMLAGSEDISDPIDEWRVTDSGWPGRTQQTVQSIFKRNPKWENRLIVADLTGSMSPYIAQLIVWLKLNAAKKIPQSYMFFNDGDMKNDGEKEIGTTGGLYYARTGNFDEVMELAIKAMSGGNGGDIPENDIEAILKAIEKCPDCSDVVLIADNYADMRDIELMGKINKQVKIVLCGTRGGINPQYLTLARQTGGSVHTIEEDILGLKKLREGESITLGGKKYTVTSGVFEFTE